MRYSGGKYRLSKKIAPIINSYIKPGMDYWEPFVGSCAVLEKITGYRNAYASDISYDLIAFWNMIKMGWEPPKFVSRDFYYQAKDNPSMLDSRPYLRAFVSVFCSYGGKHWGGYAQDKKETNYAAVQRRQSFKVKPRIKSALFWHGSYNLINTTNSVIYCDPPYRETTNGYEHKEFDHSLFWAWAADQAQDNIVLISEYKPYPEHNTEVVYRKQVKTTLAKNDYGDRVEHLFRVLPN